MTYDEVVREMMLAEGQYIRDLNMIIKVLHLTFSQYTIVANYYETHLSAVVNGWCVADKSESQPLLVSHGLWEDMSNHSHSRPKEFSQQDLAPASTPTSILT